MARKWLFTMPMDCSVHVQVVLHKNLDVVPLIKVNQGSRLLAIDEVHVSLKSIRRSSSAVDGEIELAKRSSCADSVCSDKEWEDHRERVHLCAQLIELNLA